MEDDSRHRLFYTQMIMTICQRSKDVMGEEDRVDRVILFIYY